MNLFKVRVVELKNAAQKLIWSFERSTWKAIPTPYDPHRKSQTVRIVRSKRLQPQVRGLFEILKTYLEKKPFTPEHNRLLQTCLNAHVTVPILIGTTCLASAPHHRLVAQNLMQFLDLLATDPKLKDNDPLGLCNCGRIFLKGKTSQVFCSRKCRGAKWYEKRGAEYYSTEARKERKRIRDRALARRSSALNK